MQRLQCCSGARYKLCWVGYLGINHNPSIPTLSRAANMKYITARGVQSRGWLQFIVQNVSKRCLVQGRTPRPPLSFIQPLTLTLPRRPHSCCLHNSASKRSIRRFVITEKTPTRAFSWLKATTTAFTFKTLLRHYAKRALTPRSLNVKLGP